MHCMNKLSSLCAVLLLAISASAAEPSTPAGQVDAVIDSAMRFGLVAGGVAVIEHKGEVFYERAFGKQSIESGSEMKLDTIFRIYSMSKAITSTAAMLLYEEGKFGLDEPISRYLPELANLKVGVETTDAATGQPTLELVEAQHQPTIRECFTHSAGFGYGLVARSLVDKMYKDARLLENTEPLAEKIKKLGQLPLKHQPGSQWDYSFSIDVLGRLVEVLSGQTLDVFMQQRLFEPLGMMDTGFYVPQEKKERLASVYQLTLTGKLEPSSEDLARDFTVPPVFLMGGGGLVSTVHDYLQFCRMLLHKGGLEGKRILKAETVELMTQDHIHGIPISQIGYALGMKGAGYGLGFSVTLEPFMDTRGDAGEFNWGGAASTIFWVDPKQEMIGVYLIQLLPSNFSTGLNFKKAAYRAIGAGASAN